MKTNKIKIFFSIISFCFLVTSCNNLLSELTQQKTYIQISTNLGNTTQRTVLPDFSVVKENGYTWELYCDSKVLQTWNDDDEKSAYQNMCVSKIEVDPGSYSFDLVIKKDINSNNNEIKSVTLLKGTISDCTISEGSNNLSFIMNPLPVTEGTGTIDFTLNLPNDNTVTSANAELSLYATEDKNFITENFESIENSSIRVTFPSSQINSGTYLLKISLYNNGNVTSVVNEYYTIVVIYPGVCSTETVTLTQLTKYYNVTTHYIDAKTNEEIESLTTSVYYKKDLVLALLEESTDDYSFGGYYNDPYFTNQIEKEEIYNTFPIAINQDKHIYVKFIKDLAYVDDVLEIYTERGLNTFRKIVNNSFSGIIKVGNTFFSSGDSANQSVNAKLCSDIILPDDSEWEPIGYYKTDKDNKAYNGIFDGDGKCVTNLKINSNTSTDLGFFGCVQDATIMNLYVQGNITCDSIYNIGGIVGYAKSSDNKSVTISNCINNVEITNNFSSNSVGGILGWSSGVVNINSCVNIAEITNSYTVAGILGYGDNNVTIKNCLNLGKITKPSDALNAVAGIANIYGDPEKSSSVTSCINASSIQGKDEYDNIYPIAYIASLPNATLSNNYYDSTILPTVTDVTNVHPKTSSELDNFVLEDWDNAANSKYPIPTAIKEAFENKSSCWVTLSNLLSIPENTTPGDSPVYVSGAYYVNGETGKDTNDGLSIDKPYKKLTKAITNAIASEAKTVYVSGTLNPSNQEITSPSSESHEKNSVFYIQDNAFNDVVEIIGDSGNTNFSGNDQTRIFSTLNACNFKMKNINFINGSTDGSGAAIYFYQGSLELDSCKISGNSSTDSNAYNGIYNYGYEGSVLKMTNTTCENSVYLSNTTATICNDCTIGTSDPTATDGFITLDDSTLKLDGENIVIYKPIYVKIRSSSIQIGDNYSPKEQITIKLASGITETYSNDNQYTLITNCDEVKSTYFNIVCEDSTKSATLGDDGKITVMN